MPSGVGGQFAVEVQASNLAGIDMQVFVIEVVPVAPVIMTSPVTVAELNRLYTYDVEADGAPAPMYGVRAPCWPVFSVRPWWCRSFYIGTMLPTRVHFRNICTRI